MDNQKRREFLLTGSAVVAGLSGCLGFGSEDDTPTESSPDESDATESAEQLQSGTAGPDGSSESDAVEQSTTTQQTENTPELPREMDWTDSNQAHARLNCPDSGYWKWVLSPGGSEPLEDAELTVHFENQPTMDGLAADVRDRGAVQFDVFTESGTGTVEDATVSFRGGGDDPELTMTHSGCVPEPSYIPELLYWQVDFGPGSAPPDPPLYGGNGLDLMAALGNSIDGVTENPSAGPWQGNGQFDDVDIVDRQFTFDDADDPTEVTVEFEIAAGANPRELHLVTFATPGPFSVAELALQEQTSLASGTYEGGDHGKLTATIPQPD